jgi:hypothetical protein
MNYLFKINNIQDGTRKDAMKVSIEIQRVLPDDKQALREGEMYNGVLFYGVRMRLEGVYKLNQEMAYSHGIDNAWIQVTHE